MTLDEARSSARLRGEAAECTLELLRRSSKVAVSTERAELRQVAGERRMLLVLRTPPATEWVASLDQTGQSERSP